MINFILIKNIRLHKNTIKRYQPQGDFQLNVYFNASRSTRVDCEMFKFNTKKERDEMVEKLDTLL
jgi:hypothetical protein